MDLGEACTHKAIHHDFGLLHGFFCGKMLPRIWTQMIATQNKALGIKAEAGCNVFDKAAEISRCHAGIAAILIDLIAGGFDQHVGFGCNAFKQGCFNDHRMR